MASTTASKANGLEQRLIAFAASIVSLSTKMPRTVQGRHISNQILRSIIALSSLVSADFIGAIVAENRELCRIITASIKTARGNENR